MAAERPPDVPSDPYTAAAQPDTLRAELDKRRKDKRTFTPAEVVRLLVPLCTELTELHKTGATFFVHPSAIKLLDDDGMTLDQGAAQMAPTSYRDRACLAPELRNKTGGGDARTSVFSLGAIIYEMLTSAPVGPGMRRPSEINPAVPPVLETVLSKALVGDRSHRPGDIGALAQALHHVAPKQSIPPPPADESHLDGEDGFEVDVSLSLIPPAPAGAPVIVIEPAIPPPTPSQLDVSAPDSSPGAEGARRTTERLAELKNALEADPRPRYVVIKDGMDHGPFTAVELLQQIATGSFLGDQVLRDTLTLEEHEIKEWEAFAPFAEQAKLNIDQEKERKALDRVVAKEQRSLGYKAFVAGGALVLVLAAVAGVWYRQRMTRDDSVRVSSDEAMSIDVDGGLAGGAKGPGGAWRGGGSGGPLPILPGGMSCEAARDRYVEEYNMGGGKGPPDLTAGAYAGVLNKGSYLNACGVPPTMAVNICAAVQNGRAVGVTVRTTPANAGIAGCVASQIRGMSFPAHPRLDIAYTNFAAQ